MPKKNSKRKIKDYDNCSYNSYDYYGLLKSRNKIYGIDVKRMVKTMSINEDILKVLNKPRHTALFYPEKLKRHDYYINIFRDKINSQKTFFNRELETVIEKIKTPSEAESDAYTSDLMMQGIISHEEASIDALFRGMQRRPSYSNAIKLLYAQFVHQFASAVEAVTIKVIADSGFNDDHFNRNILKAYIAGKNNVNLEDIPYYKYYDRLYKIWNFLKHNNLSTYNKLKKLYPDALHDRTYKNGEIAVFYLKINKEFIEKLFIDITKFFEEFCLAVYKESIEETSWNYTDYFIDLVSDQIELLNNPMGLPWFL